MQSKKEVRENLKAAGCSNNLAEEFMNCYRSCDLKRSRKLLDVCRQELLDAVHEGLRKIDCLDYLVYQMADKKGDK